MDEKTRLIIGLGNPGATYKDTRHNVGFNIVRTFAQKQGFSFKGAAHLVGELAQGMIDERKVLVFQPSTFMNESGVAVQKCIEYYKVPLHHFIVVSDDTALPVGAMRMRMKGSSGGHNGLKSIEMHLHSQAYPRFRIGVGNPEQESMKDYVLGTFSKEECLVMEEVIVKAVHALELWVSVGMIASMREVNRSHAQKPKQKLNEGDKTNGQAKETSL